MSLNIYEELKLYNEYKMIQLEAQKLIQISINKLTGLSVNMSASKNNPNHNNNGNNSNGDGDERARKRARVSKRDEALDLSLNNTNNRNVVNSNNKSKTDEEEEEAEEVIQPRYQVHRRQSLFSTKSEINLHKSLLINKMLNKSKMVYYEAILKTMRLTILNKLMSYLCLVQNFTTKEQHEKLGETLSAPQFRLNLNCENLKLIINEIIDYLISSGNFADTCPLYQPEQQSMHEQIAKTKHQQQSDTALVHESVTSSSSSSSELVNEQSQLNFNLSNAQRDEDEKTVVNQQNEIQEQHQQKQQQKQQQQQNNDLINEHRFTNPNYLVELLMKMNNCNKCNSCLSQIINHHHQSEINNTADIINTNNNYSTSNNKKNSDIIIIQDVNEENINDNYNYGVDHANEINRASHPEMPMHHNLTQIQENNINTGTINDKPRKSLKRKFSLIHENDNNNTNTNGCSNRKINSNEDNDDENYENEESNDDEGCVQSGTNEYQMNYERKSASLSHQYSAHSPLHHHHHQVRVVV